MLGKRRWLLVSALAVAVLLATTGGAEGFVARFLPGEAIRATSAGKITFGSSPTIQCSVTLNGSLETESIEVRVGEPLGSISEVAISSCSGGAVEEVLSLPWQLTLKAVPSGLPNEATSVELSLRNVAFLLETLGGFVNCLYGEEGSRIAGGIASLTRAEEAGLYEIGSIRSDETIQLRRISGGGFCPTEGGFRGRFTLAGRQRLNLNGIRMTCAEESGSRGFIFSRSAPLTPEEVRWVRCEYDWGTPVVEVTGTSIVGAGAAAFTLVISPAGSIRPGERVSIVIDFPSRAARRNTIYIADYRFDTDHGRITIPMRGTTAP